MEPADEYKVAPVLVFGWGNASRGDDALGPLFIERLRAWLGGRRDVALLEDFQLQIEHALDLVGRERVLFVDASSVACAPYALSAPQPAVALGVSTHAVSPQALLAVYQRLHHAPPPPCTLLAIRGEHFALGAAPSEQALRHLEAALAWAQGWLGTAPASAPAAPSWG